MALAVSGGLAFLAFAVFGLISLREREPRAARVSFGTAAAIAVTSCGVRTRSRPTFQLVVIVAITAGLTGATVAFLVPQRAEPAGGGRPSRRIDERDIMFARARLVPGSPEYDTYYTMHPENRGRRPHRRLPGLLSLEAELADAVLFAAAEASFDLTEAVRDEVDGVARRQPDRARTRAASGRSLRLARYGAPATSASPSCGPTTSTPTSDAAAGSGASRSTVEHRWAIAFTVEMDHDVIDTRRPSPGGRRVGAAVRRRRQDRASRSPR